MPRSKELEAIFKSQVNRPALLDLRSPNKDMLLGYPNDHTRKFVVARGRANFSAGHTHARYGELSADDVVLLYCYFNMKGHFDVASEVFRKFRTPALFRESQRTLLIDVGCGPGTVFLALADVHRSQSFGYIGVDSATPMQVKAQAMWQAAKEAKLVGNPSKARFYSSWQDIPLADLKMNLRVMISFSYFFASPTLTGEAIHSLVKFICTLRDSPKVSSLCVTYMNATFPEATRNYRSFKEILGFKSKPAQLNLTTEYEVLLLKETGE